MPKVSIIIAAYNSRNLLPATLESVFSQTYTNYDVVIVDDGSTDSTVEWIQSLQDPRIRLITQKNQGLANSRNAAIAQIESDYIAILDHDDLWMPTKLEKQVKILDDQSNIGFVYTWTALADSEGIATGKVIKSDPQDDAWRQLVEFNIVVCGSTPLIRKECFEKVGGFEKDLSGCDDWDMWLRMAKHYKFAVVKEPLVLYRLSQTNMSSNFEFMRKTTHKLIERAFSEVDIDLLPLRNHSYSATYLYLGWRALSCNNVETAISSLEYALKYRPLLVFSRKYWQLKLSIILVRLFGINSYTNLRDIKFLFRGKFLGRTA